MRLAWVSHVVARSMQRLCECICEGVCVLRWVSVRAGLMDYCVADYTWARAVLLLGPTVATLGMSVQVPLATGADAVLGHPHWLDSWKAVGLTAVGSVLILGGVGGINLDPYSRPTPQQCLMDPETAHDSTSPLLTAAQDPL